MQQTATDAELADQAGVGVGVLWPWALFAASLAVGLASFFAFTPR